MLKFATLAVIEAKTARSGHGLMKDAHRHAFEYDPKPGFLYVRSRAISSRCNDNFDEFPAPEIKAAYRTFVGKPVFVNHVNADHKRARGVIVDAALHEDVNPDGSPDVWCEVLMEVDAINFPMLAKAILAGEADRTSMGCDVGFSVCSFCGNKAQTPLDYCAHIKYHKGKRIRRRNAALGVHEDVLVREICHKLSFFENSILVEEPADPTAFFLGVESGDDLVAAARKTAAIDVEARTSVPKGQVATMIDALAGKLKDSEFGNISDLCEVAVEGTNLFCSSSKGIPRSKMPQLTDKSGKDITSEWKKSLKDEGISVTDETVSAASLKASQNQLNGKKVAAIYDKIKAGTLDNDRIFVSSDGYIVDGHHRWAAKVAYDLLDADLGDVMMPVTRVGLPIIELLDKANAFAKEHGIAQRGINAHLRVYAVGLLDTPVAAFGMTYDADVAHTSDVVRAMNTDFEVLPTTKLPKGVKLYATEQMLSSASISKVVNGGEAVRPGYDAYVMLDSAGRYVVIDGHHRVAIYKGLGVDLPVKLLDLSMSAAASLDQMALSIMAAIGDPGYLDNADFAVLQARVKAKVAAAPIPTQADIERNLHAMRTDGRAGGDFRGNSYDRRRRSQRLLEEFGNGVTAGCSYCGKILDASTLTEDKIITGKLGGRYILPNLIPACQPCNAKRSDSPFSAVAAIEKSARHILKLKQIRPGDIIGSFGGAVVTEVETDVPLYADGTTGIKLTFDRDLGGGRRSITMRGDETLLVENPGSRKPPAYEPPPPPKPGDRIKGHCPVCQREVTYAMGGKLPRHNRYKPGRGTANSVCPGAGLTVEDADQVRKDEDRAWRDSQRWSSKTASYGTLWRSSTGGLHKSLLCPNISAQSNLTPVPVDDVTEAAVVASKAKDACSLCFPSAPSRRTPAMATASLERFVASYSDLTEDQLRTSYYTWIEDSRNDPFGTSQVHIDAITGIEAEFDRRGLPKPPWPARVAAMVSSCPDCGRPVERWDGQALRPGVSDPESLWYCPYCDASGRDEPGFGFSFDASLHTALGEQKAPPEVDTLRDEACPVCGETEAYTGDDCGVCGFKKPPDAFMDPDVEKAKQVDLRQDQEEAADGAAAATNPTLQCSNCGKTFGGGPAAPGAPTPKAPAAGGSGVERFKVGKKGESCPSCYGDVDHPRFRIGRGFCHDTFHSKKTAFLPEPEKDGTPSGEQQPETTPQAGDACPDCGEGTLNPVEAPASPPQEVEPSAEESPSGESEEEVTDAPGKPAEGDESESKPFEKKDDDEDDPDAPKEQSRRKEKTAMRPTLRALAEQQIMLQATMRAVDTIADAAGIDISPVKAEATRKIATLRAQADVENPANPIPEPAPEAPAATTEEAKTPEARVDVTQQGGVPANGDVPPDATTSVTEPGGVVLPVETTPQNAQDPTKPVAGTTEPVDGKIEGEVKVGDPNKTETMYPVSEGGWQNTSSARTMAAIRLARLRIEAGLEPPQDDLALGTSLASNASLTDEAMAQEIATLDKVAKARPAQPQQQPVSRSLVPRAAAVVGSGDRSVPSLAPQAAPAAVPGTQPSMAPTAGETDGLW